MPMWVERVRPMLLAVVCGFFAHHNALAGNDELPDIEFLDYLGSWEASDEDWQLVNDADKAREQVVNIEQTNPAAESEELTETENEL